MMRNMKTPLRSISILCVASLFWSCSGTEKTDEPPEILAAKRQCRPPSQSVVEIKGGSFEMGQSQFYREEGPERNVTVNSFAMDVNEVTNAAFRKFVDDTNYITVAEKPVDASQFNVPVDQIPVDMLKPGSAVFMPPETPTANPARWWTYVPGANWKKPFGPTGPDAKETESAVHLSYADMQAYARWKGGRLPTEAEWEYAALGGGEDTHDQPVEANSWQGVFPVRNLGTDGFEALAPVGCFKPNAFGLYDMIGNAWEMTSDLYAPSHAASESTKNLTAPAEASAFDPQNPEFKFRVIKGGSFLCAPNYCQRYRPAARSARDPGLGASNVGFRLVYDRQDVSAKNLKEAGA